MAPLRGWAPLGQRIKAKVPHGRWKTMTFLAALRQDRITAPWFIDEPINSETFQLYIEKVLVPTLRPSDIVIMDNLGSHKGKAVRSAIRAADARLFYLPKYSPDLNPIEQFFAKLAFRNTLLQTLRPAAGFQRLGPRAVDGLHNAVEVALPRQLQHRQIFCAGRQRRFHGPQPLRPAPENPRQQCG